MRLEDCELKKTVMYNSQRYGVMVGTVVDICYNYQDISKIGFFTTAPLVFFNTLGTSISIEPELLIDPIEQISSKAAPAFNK